MTTGILDENRATHGSQDFEDVRTWRRTSSGPRSSDARILEFQRTSGPRTSGRGPARASACSVDRAQSSCGLTAEYPANGSLTEPPHAAVSARIVQNKLYGQASRLISIGKLNVSPRLHTRPIAWSSSRSLQRPCGLGRSHLVEGFTLRCLQRFSLPDVATRRYRWRDNRYTRGPSIPVLSY